VHSALILWCSFRWTILRNMQRVVRPPWCRVPGDRNTVWPT
jgi:hypothetical protein